MLIISNFCDFSYDKHFPHSRSLTPMRWPWNFPCLKTWEAPVHTLGGPRSGQPEVLSWQAAGGRGHQQGPGWQSRSPGAHTPGQGRVVCREQVTWAESQSDEARGSSVLQCSGGGDAREARRQGGVRGRRRPKARACAVPLLECSCLQHTRLTDSVHGPRVGGRNRQQGHLAWGCCHGSVLHPSPPICP